MDKNKILLLGNLIFGIFAIIFWTARFFDPAIPIAIPATLTGIQLIFLLIAINNK